MSTQYEQGYVHHNADARGLIWITRIEGNMRGRILTIRM